MNISEVIRRMNNSIEHLAAVNKPFFYAKNVNGTVETKGLHACLLGHKIGSPSNAKTDGVFAAWEWNGQKLTVTNDRYGFYPLYYFYRDNEIILSPSIRKLLEEGASSELDYPALSVFLRLGFFIGEDTPLKYIRALPPDATFSWEKGDLTVRGQYARQELINISKDDAIDQYIHLFREAMKKRLPSDENFIVPLSGGRDSRHILLELDYLGYTPKACVTVKTYTTAYNESIHPAQKLSDRLKVNHILLNGGNINFKNEIRNFEMTNYCADEHGQFLILTDYILKQNSINTSYDGIAGDNLSGDFRGVKISHLLKNRSYSEFVKFAFTSHCTPVEYDLKMILDEKFYSKVSFDCAVEHLTDELKKHVNYPNPTKSFSFWNRTRREIALAPYALNAEIPKVYSPYLDHDLYDFLAALPENFTDKATTFHTKVIERAYPRCADIPFAADEEIGSIVIENRIKYTQEFAKYYLKNFITTSDFFKAGYFFPRMAKCLLSKKYCKASWWMELPTILYLIKLEKLINGDS